MKIIRNIKVCAVFILLSMPVFADITPKINTVDSIDGFRDIRFNQKITSDKSFIKKDACFYIRRSDNLIFEDCEFDCIEYFDVTGFAKSVSGVRDITLKYNPICESEAKKYLEHFVNYFTSIYGVGKYTKIKNREDDRTTSIIEEICWVGVVNEIEIKLVRDTITSPVFDTVNIYFFYISFRSPVKSD